MIPGPDIPIAFLAGFVSFISPCVLPLVPGYISAISGVDVGDVPGASWRRVLAPSLLFIGTFSAIFIAMGLTATALGQVLRDHQELLSTIGAILLIVMGSFFVATLFIDRLNRDWRVDSLLARAGKGGPVIAGAAFAIAWTPCIGPTLGGVLTLAGVQGETGYGALLLAIYALGLGVPFLITALTFSRATSAFAAVRRHYRKLACASGAILIAMGVLILSGGFSALNIWAQRITAELGLNL